VLKVQTERALVRLGLARQAHHLCHLCLDLLLLGLALQVRLSHLLRFLAMQPLLGLRLEVLMLRLPLCYSFNFSWL
jgi:hypothetical protein